MKDRDPSGPQSSDPQSKIKLYVLIDNFASLYKVGSRLELEEHIEKNEVPRWGGKIAFFGDLQNALRIASESDMRHNTSNHCVIEFEIDPIKWPIPANRRLDYDRSILQEMKAFYHPKGFYLPISDLDYRVVENKHNVALQEYCASNPVNLSLTQPPLEYLSQLPLELRFLLFVDYQLFARCESWQDYDNREFGCVGNLCNGVRTVCETLSPSGKSKVNIHDITSLHAILSEKLGQTLGATIRSGEFRTNYINFPLSVTTASRDGIRELLSRIKNDNRSDGFAVGELERTFIIKEFAQLMSEKMNEFQNITDPELAKKKYQEIKENFVNNIYDKLKNDFIGIEKSKVIAILEGSLAKHGFDGERLFEPLNYKNSSDRKKRYEFENFLDLMGNKLLRLHQKSVTMATEDEAKFELEYARNNALGRAGLDGNIDISQYSDDQLNKLADEIYAAMQSGSTIRLFPPEPRLAREYALNAINNYNADIKNAKTPEEKIAVIDRLIHEIEILHLFDDVNCRTCYLEMNRLLLENGIKWSMLYDPNRIDALSAKERCEEIQKGIARFEYVLANRVELLDYNTKVLTSNSPRPEMFTDLFDTYKSIAAPLQMLDRREQSKHSQPEFTAAASSSSAAQSKAPPPATHTATEAKTASALNRFGYFPPLTQQREEANADKKAVAEDESRRTRKPGTSGQE